MLLTHANPKNKIAFNVLDRLLQSNTESFHILYAVYKEGYITLNQLLMTVYKSQGAEFNAEDPDAIVVSNRTTRVVFRPSKSIASISSADTRPHDGLSYQLDLDLEYGFITDVHCTKNGKNYWRDTTTQKHFRNGYMLMTTRAFFDGYSPVILKGTETCFNEEFSTYRKVRMFEDSFEHCITKYINDQLFIQEFNSENKTRKISNTSYCDEHGKVSTIYSDANNIYRHYGMESHPLLATWVETTGNKLLHNSKTSIFYRFDEKKRLTGIEIKTTGLHAASLVPDRQTIYEINHDDVI